MPMRAVIFDVDGTLVDSQADILGAMNAAIAAEGLKALERDAVLGIVGLSLDVAIPRLLPDVGHDRCQRVVQGYKDAYMDMRKLNGAAQSSPFYDGARAALDALASRDDILLGVATGKSRRGLNKLIESHALEGVFASQHCADDHPSKPHPSMLEAVVLDLGVEKHDAVMIGDTSFDLDMARAAGVGFVGVSWGYHPRSALAQADAIVDSFDDLAGALDRIWVARHG